MSDWNETVQKLNEQHEVQNSDAKPHITSLFQVIQDHYSAVRMSLNDQSLNKSKQQEINEVTREGLRNIGIDPDHFDWEEQ